MHQIVYLRVGCLLAVAMIVGCAESETASAPAENSSPIVEIDDDGFFEDVLKQVDSVAGKRFQQMQMGGMNSVTYMYDGPIEEITEVVDPVAESHAYNAMPQAETANSLEDGLEQAQLFGAGEFDLGGQKSYRNSHGNMLMLMRMDVSQKTAEMSRDLQMLTVQLMNPKNFSESANGN